MTKQELSKIVLDNGKKVKFTFIDGDSYYRFKPYVQCYGLCFNNKGEILIGRNSYAAEGRWLLPGGRAEKGETPVRTLKRELLEEADIKIGKFKLLGGQRVDFLEEKKKPVFQLRFAAMIKEIMKQTPDPDNGQMWELKFVNPEEVNYYLQWGDILEHLVKKAKEWHDKEIQKLR
jgi:NADH pyrophosphatase NudC (nudix superfamily)